jgi:hypothetical protein
MHSTFYILCLTVTSKGADTRGTVTDGLPISNMSFKAKGTGTLKINFEKNYDFSHGYLTNSRFPCSKAVPIKQRFSGNSFSKAAPLVGWQNHWHI